LSQYQKRIRQSAKDLCCHPLAGREEKKKKGDGESPLKRTEKKTTGHQRGGVNHPGLPLYKNQGGGRGGGKEGGGERGQEGLPVVSFRGEMVSWGRESGPYTSRQSQHFPVGWGRKNGAVQGKDGKNAMEPSAQERTIDRS